MHCSCERGRATTFAQAHNETRNEAAHAELRTAIAGVAADVAKVAAAIAKVAADVAYLRGRHDERDPQ